MPRPRVLLALTVYDGRAFVPAALESIARLEPATCDVDVLVLDDASPDPGWSEELAAHCARLELGYYRTPRNLGIVRNCNLGLLRSRQQGYEYCLLANSDVLYSTTALDALIAAARSDPAIGSVTAWSTNVSVYSLTNDDPDRYVNDVPTVDAVGSALSTEFADEAVDVPTGIGFCFLVTAEALETVGLFDPVFRRGYCEENDWCLRSLALGYRTTLAPGAFVYHAGRGSMIAAGVLTGHQTTLPANEAVIDLRYPGFRGSVTEFMAAPVLDDLRERGSRAIVSAAAAQHGYEVDLSWLRRAGEHGARVRVRVDPDGRAPVVSADWRGFRMPVLVTDEPLAAAIRSTFGGDPGALTVHDRGRHRDALVEEFGKVGVPTRVATAYPERV